MLEYSVCKTILDIKGGIMKVSQKIFLAALFYFISVSPVFSNNSAFLDEDSDPYAQLDEMFEFGILPAIEDVHGWYSGRCYSSVDHVKPMNTLLLGKLEEIEDGGPLFPPMKTKIAAFHLWDKLPNYFDTISDELAGTIQNKLKWDSWSEAGTVLSDSLFFFDHNVTGLYYTQVNSHIRKYDNFLINRLESRVTEKVEYICYYFKKVRD